MLRLRTKLSLLMTIVLGIGIGVLSGFADGAYSAICLLVLPLLVALTGASIVADSSGPALQTEVEEKVVAAKTSDLGSTTSWGRRPAQKIIRQVGI
jgi:hypothetical protein